MDKELRDDCEDGVDIEDVRQRPLLRENCQRLQARW